MENKIIFAVAAGLCVSGLLFVYWPQIRRRLRRLFLGAPRETLRSRVEVWNGTIHDKHLKKQLYETKETLRFSGRENLFHLITFLSILLCIVGIIAGMLMHNYFLTPILALLGCLAPFLCIKVMTSLYRKRINTDLEDALFAVTYNYLINDDFISVVRENVELMAPSIQNVFQQFLTESTRIDADVNAGIQNMKLRISNPIFHEWCDCVIQAQEDSTIKGNLLPIVERFSDNHIIQHEVQTLIAGARRNALALLAITTLFPLLVRVLNQEWFAVYNTNAGKFAIAFTVVVLLFSVWRIFKLSRPVEVEEKK